MNKVLFSVVLFLLGISLGQAQDADKTTNITREDWKAKDDIQILKDKYDLQDVAMDEVYVIRNNKMEKVKTPKEKNLNLNNSNSKTSTKAGSAKESSKNVKSSSTKTRSKQKKKRKVFKKRLKNRKFKKYTGKSCFSF